MDGFDQLNSLNPENEINSYQQQDDLVGSDIPANPEGRRLKNVFDSDSTTQQPDISWITDDVSSGATDAAPQNQSAHYDLPDDTSPTRSFSYDSSSHQLDIQDFQSNSTPNFTLASKDDYSLDVSDQPSPTEDNSSFNRYDDGSSSPSLPDQSSFVAKDNLSALHALNARRQQEIAEMEVVEKQKIEELRQQAKKDLEHWYEERRVQMEQKRRTMKQEEQDSFTQALEKSDKQSCDWAKVIRLLDFSQGTQITKQKRDINRMRAVIVQVKRDRDGSKSENGV